MNRLVIFIIVVALCLNLGSSITVRSTGQSKNHELTEIILEANGDIIMNLEANGDIIESIDLKQINKQYLNFLFFVTFPIS